MYVHTRGCGMNILPTSKKSSKYYKEVLVEEQQELFEYLVVFPKECGMVSTSAIINYQHYILRILDSPQFQIQQIIEICNVPVNTGIFSSTLKRGVSTNIQSPLIYIYLTQLNMAYYFQAKFFSHSSARRQAILLWLVHSLA